jgi:hypothetical protein
MSRDLILGSIGWYIATIEFGYLMFQRNKIKSLEKRITDMEEKFSQYLSLIDKLSKQPPKSLPHKLRSPLPV